MDSDRQRLLQLFRDFAFKEGDFVLSSGRKSRYFVDTKRVALHPEGAHLLGRELLAMIRQQWPDAQAVGGETLGADPLAVAVAIASWGSDGPPLNAFVVRKAVKDHGTKQAIEVSGALPPRAQVVVIDDVVTTGGSGGRAVQACREAGYDVLGVVTVVDRGQGGRAHFEALDLELKALFRIDDLVNA